MLSLRFPHSPFSTPLSGSAKEVEQRLRSIFRPPEKRPPLPTRLLSCILALSCGGLVSCQAQPEESSVWPQTLGTPLEVVQTLPSLAQTTLGNPPLEGLTVENLPSAPVDLEHFDQSESWNETVWLLTQDTERDVALYGVIQFENYESGTVNSSGLYGVMVRSHTQLAFYPLDWSINLWAYESPELWFGDWDEDGQEELAFSLTWGRGSMVWQESLYLVELDSLNYSTPDFTFPSGLTASYDPDSMTLYAITENQLLLMDESWLEGAPILEGTVQNGNQVEFSYEDGLLRCRMSYLPSEAPLSSPAIVDYVIQIQDGRYVLSDPEISPNTLSAPNHRLLWITENGQVLQAETLEEYEAGGTPYADEDGHLYYRF